MNSITIKGRLAKEPEMRMASQSVVCVTTVAVNRKFKRDETDFFDIQAWGKTGEILKNYFNKGQEILVQGEMQCTSYTDKDGIKRQAWRINAENIEFCGSKGSDGRAASGTSYSLNDNSTFNSVSPISQNTANDEVFTPAEGIDDDDLPF